MIIKVAHSPDSDDAFMFYALEQKKLETGLYEFKTEMADIESLNTNAQSIQEYDISAISFHAYAYLDDNYILMASGSSFGDNYGPTLICNASQDPAELLTKVKAGEETVLIPGILTSAYLTLKLFAPKVKTQALPFDQIQEALKNGEHLVGLIIHEGQITYKQNGFTKLINLGEWWFERTGGLPLPLGANIVKCSLKEEIKKDLSLILKQSIEYAFQNREEAIQYALKFSKDLGILEADRFIGMYVNELSLDLGSRGRKAVELFFKEAYQLGFIPKMPHLEFV